MFADRYAHTIWSWPPVQDQMYKLNLISGKGRVFTLEFLYNEGCLRLSKGGGMTQSGVVDLMPQGARRPPKG